MEEQVIKNKLEIPAYAKVKVYWDDKPENYSREGRNRVKSHFSRKYGVHKNNVNVIFRPVKVDDSGNTIEITGAGIDNIMDVNYQRQLFKEWLDRESKDVPFDRILKLDEKVNADLDVDLNQLGHKKWEIRWLKINNFLCFGEDNYINFGKLRGLNIVNSNPENQGGKTTFSVDTLKFLLFGKTTKTNTNEEIFNSFSDKNEVIVRGMINYDDKDIIIERVMKRSPKRNGGWNIKNKLTYYKLMPDGEEIPLEEEHATATTAEISRMIGSESDFDITILATAKNLEDLIDSTPTQSGKLITKFIGLEVIEKKEAIARKMHNEFSKKMKSNLYDISTLKTEIEEHEETIKEDTKTMSDKQKRLDEVKVEIDNLNTQKDNLLTSKKPVDSEVSQLNPSSIESDIAKITTEGTKYATEIESYTKEIKDIGEVSYDEIDYFEKTKEYNSLDVKLNTNRANKKSHESMIDQLKNGEICPTCKRALDDVDHTKEIKEEEAKIDKLDTEYEVGSRKLANLKVEIDKMDADKKKVDKKNQIELKKDRAEVEIDSLRSKIKEKKADLKKYQANKDAINHNISVDSEIEAVKTNIKVKETEKDDLIRTIQILEGNIEKNQTQIKEKDGLITTIRKEKDVDTIFKVYIEMVGKKGISKLVLRSVLPIINSELYRLMEDVVDFTVELNINDKNNVEFVLIKNEVEKLLMSGSGLEKTAASLALRCVLGKMSNLPMPNFVTFDEVFGKVAEVNIEKMKPMFDKIKGMYDIVFLITMRDLVKDWGDNIITINKVNDISSITVK